MQLAADSNGADPETPRHAEMARESNRKQVPPTASESVSPNTDDRPAPKLRERRPIDKSLLAIPEAQTFAGQGSPAVCRDPSLFGLWTAARGGASSEIFTAQRPGA